MAAASFRSATRMDSFEDAGSATRGRGAAAGSGGSGGLRRSRSLSRFPPPSPSSRFVNKVRGGGGGGGLPEVSLDDLADEFFRARAESEDDDEEVVARGRLRFPAPAERGGGRRSSTARYARETESSRQRGRSASRPPAEQRGRAAAVANGSAEARRQRYASVDRRALMDQHRWCDSDELQSRRSQAGEDAKRTSDCGASAHALLVKSRRLPSGPLGNPRPGVRPRRHARQTIQCASAAPPTSSVRRASRSPSGISVSRQNDMGIPHQYGSRGINTKSSTGNSPQNPFHKSAKVNQSMMRSTSQKDFLHSRDSSSSHSSLTDDESRDAHSFHSRNQKGIRAVYAVEKEQPIGDEEGNVPYDVMRKEVRQAVEEIRSQLEKAVTNSESLQKATSTGEQPTQVITELRRSYTSKLEESEKRKQELLAQLVAEEQRGHELIKMVRELLPTAKKNANPERQPWHRRRSNDRARMSKSLTEEAEQYFEDFLSNVEDTDFSSFDGERSDTSSTRRDVLLHCMIETPVAIPKVASPAESDGVVLPWLQWETSNDLQTSPCKTKTQGASTACSTSNHTMSSRGSWSPGDHDSSAASKDKLLSRFDEVGICQSSCNNRSSSFHIDDYLHLRRSEDLLFERWRQKQRIDDGGLILCIRSTIM